MKIDFTKFLFCFKWLGFFSCKFTVWKLKNFSSTQILREIKVFWIFRLKMCHWNTFIGSEFWFVRFFALLKLLKFTKLTKFKFKVGNTDFFPFKIVSIHPSKSHTMPWLYTNTELLALFFEFAGFKKRIFRLCKWHTYVVTQSEAGCTFEFTQSDAFFNSDEKARAFRGKYTVTELSVKTFCKFWIWPVKRSTFLSTK